MGKGINKVFVNLGIILIILGLVAAGMQMRGVNLPFVDKEFKEAAEVMRKESSSSAKSYTADDSVVIAENNDSVTEKSADVSSSSTSSKKDEWVQVGHKICVIAWNNKDFNEGWCKIATFKPGMYRFVSKSSLVFSGSDGKHLIIPSTGTSIKRWRDNDDNAFADFFDTWTPINNGNLGQVIFKMKDDALFINNDFQLKNSNVLYLSINFPASEDNWKKYGFNGTITIDIFKKKS